jgi:cell division GTPase FtsZ
MEGELLQMLMSGGANVAFAIFLYTQNKELQKRADSREAKAEQKIEELRERYDSVIADYKHKEVELRDTIVREMADLDKRMSLIEQSMTNISTVIAEIKSALMRVHDAS